MIHLITSTCLLFPTYSMPTTTFTVVDKFIKTDVYERQVVDTYYIELSAEPTLYVEVSAEEHNKINQRDSVKITNCTATKQLIKKTPKYVQKRA